MAKKIRTIGSEKCIRQVKLASDLNELQFKGFERFDIDMFNLVVNKLTKKGLSLEENDRTIHITISEILKVYEASLSDAKKAKKLVYNNFSAKELKIMSNKFHNCIVSREVGENGGFVSFGLFERFAYVPEKNRIEIMVTPTSAKWFTELNRLNYTKYPLLDVLSIKGKYAKRLFMLLAQFQETCLYAVRIDDIKFLLNITDGYKTNGRVTQTIKEACDELKELKLFPYLRCLTVTDAKTGVTTGYRFTWRKTDFKQENEINKKALNHKIKDEIGQPEYPEDNAGEVDQEKIKAIQDDLKGLSGR